MKDDTLLRASFTGAIAPGSRLSHTLAQPRIRYCWFIDPYYLTPVAPWGLIIPTEGGEAQPIRFSAEFQTAGLPEGTMLGMRWTPADGRNIHTSSIRLSGSTTVDAELPLEDGWIVEAEGQDVLIEHEVVLLDGSVRVGQPLTLHVAKKLAFGTMTVHGLKDGDMLFPDRFPDGIQVSYTPIANVQGFHLVSHTWQVIGVRGNGYSLLYTLDTRYPGAPGEGYEFFIPPEGYTNLHDPYWDRVYVQALATVKLAPEPNQWFWYGYGGQIFDVSETRNAS